MRVLRYFAAFYTGVFLLTASVLTIIVVAITLVESAGKLVAQEDATTSALALAFYTSIRFLYLVLPIATLIATLAAGTLLARRGEILACQCAGTPMMVLWLSFGVPVILTAALGIFASDTAVPWAQERIAAAKTLGQDRMAKVYGQTLHWFQSGDTILHFPRVERHERRVISPVLFIFKDKKIKTIVRAQSLKLESQTGGQNRWMLIDGQENDLIAGKRRPFARQAVDLSLDLGDLVDAQGDARGMRREEIKTTIVRRDRAGLNSRPQRLEWWSRITYPLSCLFMFVLVSPFVFRASTRRSLSTHLGAAVVTVGLLLYVEQVGRLLALAEKIPIGVGALGLSTLCILAWPLSNLLARRLD